MKNKKSYFCKITSYPGLRCIPATLDVHSILHSFHLPMSAILSHFHRGLLHSFKMASYYFIACMDHNLFSPSFLLQWRYKDTVEPGSCIHGTHSYEWNQRFCALETAARSPTLTSKEAALISTSSNAAASRAVFSGSKFMPLKWQPGPSKLCRFDLHF